MTILAPTHLFDGEAIHTGTAVRIENGRIVDVLGTAPVEAQRLDGILAPGFIDIQVNGGGGVLFNDAPTVDALHTIATAHARLGVTSVMATLISDSRAKTNAAIDAVDTAIKAGMPGLLGLHLEGPWLSESRRGVHPAANLRPLDDADLALFAQPRDFPLMVTVAPECLAPADIAKLVASGVRVSLGHTEANAATVEAALAAGATSFTHLFNAMPAMESRNPGPVGVALANTNAFTGLILDGIHVHPTTARAAFLAKSAARMILVSDAMTTVGANKTEMPLFGETVHLVEGALRTPSGTLAGAHLDLTKAVRNAVSLIGASQDDALRMATQTPADFLGLTDRGRITPGAHADLVLLDEGLDVQRVWIGGSLVG